MKRFKNILIVCDEDGDAEIAVERGLWLAKANGARATLLDVIETSKGTLGASFASLPEARASEIEDQILIHYTDRLRSRAADFEDAGVAVDVEVVQGVGFIEAIRAVLRNSHDLIVKNASPSSTSNWLFAGNDMHILRKCPCPVWMLKADQPRRTERILAAIDPDPLDPTRDALNRVTMELATSLAERDEAELHVINAWRLQEETTLRSGRFAMSDSEIATILAGEQAEAQARLDAFLERFPQGAKRREVILRKGFAGDVIPEYARAANIDTVVMGTLGRAGIRGLFIGNTAETILGAVHCSVMTIKPPGFETPVELED
ncbi:MAG: universal stress protein [Pseudomonadota bacterium]